MEALTSLINKKTFKKQVDPVSSDFLRLNKFFNTVVGLPLFVFYEKYRLMATYQRMTEIILTLGFLGQLMALPVIRQDMNVFCGCLASTTHCLQILSKTYFLRSISNKFREHMSNLDEIMKLNNYLNQEMNSIIIMDFKEFHIEQSSNVRLALVTLFCMTVASTSSYFLPIDLESIIRWDDLTGQLTPIVFYIHLDIMFTPIFQLVNVFLTICFYLTNLKTIVIDGFVLAVIVLHTTQFRHIKKLIETVVSLDEIDNEKSSKRVFYLRKCIRLHQKQLSSTEEIAKMLSPYLFIEFAYVFIHTCVPAFVITSTLSWTLPQKFAVFFIMGAGFFQLLLLARAGDALTEAARLCTNSLYRPAFFDKPSRWESLSILLTTLKCQIPLKLSAFGILPLCSPTFISISRLIMSYYITLNEVQHMKTK